MAWLVAGVLPPNTLRAGKSDYDLIYPPVPIHIRRPTEEALAVTVRGIELLDGRQLMLRPIRRFVPKTARKDIRLAIVVDIPYGHSFGTELLIQSDLGPSHLASMSRGRGPGVSYCNDR